MSLNTIKKTVTNANKKVGEFLAYLQEQFPGNNEINNLLTEVQTENFNIIKENNDELVIKTFRNDIKNLTSMKFISHLQNNIKILETNIIIEYDSMNKYTSFEKLLSKSIHKDHKLTKLIENIRVFQKIPVNISEQITIIPFVESLTLTNLLNVNETFQMFQNIKTLYAYAHVYLKVIDQMFEKYDQDINNDGNDLEMQEKIFDEVKTHVEQFESKGLNLALDEVISELSTNKECSINNVVAEGMNTITSTKVMDMAKKVADKLSTKIQSGEVEVDELVDSSKNFIGNIINSDMFKNHPNSAQVEGMFSSLMDTVTQLSEAYKENKDGEIIDEILEKYD